MLQQSEIMVGYIAQALSGVKVTSLELGQEGIRESNHTAGVLLMFSGFLTICFMVVCVPVFPETETRHAYRGFVR